MDSLFDFFQPDNLPIDYVIILLVLLAGQFQKRYLFHMNMSGAMKTLLVSFVFTFVYAILLTLSEGFTKQLPLRWFFSYVVATSLYELILKRWIEKFFSDSKKIPDESE